MPFFSNNIYLIIDTTIIPEPSKVLELTPRNKPVFSKSTLCVSLTARHRNAHRNWTGERIYKKRYEWSCILFCDKLILINVRLSSEGIPDNPKFLHESARFEWSGTGPDWCLY